MIKNKRGQVKISFGMLFSVILIIVFISFAIFAVIKIIDLNKAIQIQTLKNSLKEDVDKVWASTSSSVEKTYYLPQNVELVCFVDFEESIGSEFEDLRRISNEDNLFFYPLEKANYESAKIERIDLGKIISSENPYCIRVVNGKIKLILKKEFNERLVTIYRE